MKLSTVAKNYKPPILADFPSIRLYLGISLLRKIIPAEKRNLSSGGKSASVGEKSN